MSGIFINIPASDALPSQAGNAGKFLTTDGTDASWAVVSGGGASWLLIGNSGTDPDVNFLGTIDNKDFKIKVNNTLALVVQSADLSIVATGVVNASAFTTAGRVTCLDLDINASVISAASSIISFRPDGSGLMAQIGQNGYGKFLDTLDGTNLSIDGGQLYLKIAPTPGLVPGFGSLSYSGSNLFVYVSAPSIGGTIPFITNNLANGLTFTDADGNLLNDPSTYKNVSNEIVSSAFVATNGARGFVGYGGLLTGLQPDIIYDAPGGQQTLLGAGELYALAGGLSFNWTDRRAFASDGSTVVFDYSGTNGATAKYYFDSSNTYRLTGDGAGLTGVTASASHTVIDSGGTVTADGDAKTLSAGFFSVALDWGNRQLKNGATASLDWANDLLIDDSSNPVMGWAGNQLLGFFSKASTPVSRPSSSGAQTAGATYTSTEQNMLQEVYDAIRALGLMS